MQRGNVYIFSGFCITLFIVLHSANAIPFYPSGYSNSRHKDYLVEIEDPDQVLEMLARLGQSILRAQHEGSNSKRGLDLGLGRGFSGSQAAKHLMGLAAANFAAGPGKKKRGEDGVIELRNPELLSYRSSSPILAQDIMSSSPALSNSNENDGWMGSRKE